MEHSVRVAGSRPRIEPEPFSMVPTGLRHSVMVTNELRLDSALVTFRISRLILTLFDEYVVGGSICTLAEQF
jgi:hypothetical protein